MNLIVDGGAFIINRCIKMPMAEKPMLKFGFKQDLTQIAHQIIITMAHGKARPHAPRLLGDQTVSCGAVWVMI